MDNCKLCFETYNENVRPRCLHCGHSFCSSCLNNLFKDGKLSCPKCKQCHFAVSVNDFPINYDLEENISNTKKTQVDLTLLDQLVGSSSKMKAFINEQRDNTKTLILESVDLESQLKGYDYLLFDRKTKHKELLKKVNDLANQNEFVMKQIDDEHNKVAEMIKKADLFREQVKDKLHSLNNATDTKSAVSAIAELDQCFAALEEWNKRCQWLFPNAKIITSSEKVLINTKAVLSVVDSEGDEFSPEIPDLSLTGVTILEKVGMISGNSILSLQRLQKLSVTTQCFLNAGLVYAIQSNKGCIRSAKVSFNDDKLYLHYLQNGDPPAYVHTIKQSDLLNLVKVDSTEVFLDLSWEGSLRGRVHILLYSNTPYVRQFRMLCTGNLGPTYAHSKFLDVKGKGDTIYESVYAGDYEYNNGNGGASIVEGLEKNDPLCKRPLVEGMMWILYDKGYKPLSAQFGIRIGKGDPNIFYDHVFGEVQDGLDVLKKAAKVDNIRSVEIIDCGVVLPI